MLLLEARARNAEITATRSYIIRRAAPAPSTHCEARRPIQEQLECGPLGVHFEKLQGGALRGLIETDVGPARVHTNGDEKLIIQDVSEGSTMGGQWLAFNDKKNKQNKKKQIRRETSIESGQSYSRALEPRDGKLTAKRDTNLEEPLP